MIPLLRLNLRKSLQFFYSQSNNNGSGGDKEKQLLQQEENLGKSLIVGGGCFWCIEGLFRRVKGVINVHSGYAGGNIINPTYKQVCTGKTGHAQVCKIFYRPPEFPVQGKHKITAKQLYTIFFYLHDPTTLNSQGPDHGTQYRSVIYYDSQEQKKIAQQVRDQITAQKLYPNPIVTQIKPLSQNPYFEAEDYHQSYFQQNQNKNPYCQIVFPKIQKLKKKFPNHYGKPKQT